MSELLALVASGENVLPGSVIGARVRRFDNVADVLAFLDHEEDGIVALTPFAGSTFLSPIMDRLAGILTLTGTRTGHLAIVSREYRIPCVLQTRIEGEIAGREILLDARDAATARLYACPLALLAALRDAMALSRAELERAAAPATDLEAALEILTAAGYVETAAGERAHYRLGDAGRRALERA
jgi:phosphoenolpyruvate-protein kinase (PTS system EI component)